MVLRDYRKYERLRIASNGNIGIGNNAPIAPLCVGNSDVLGSDGFIVMIDVLILVLSEYFA